MSRKKACADQAPTATNTRQQTDQARLSTDAIDHYFELQQKKTLLRFITCGSVDDGKSTLIGRLLYDSQMVLDDQLQQLEAQRKRTGNHDDELDFAQLVDGLAAEREQGITIDVAYRFFVTEKRKFIVADVPGHEQYTRNMVTGASTADLAVILIDARKGVLTQTQRHSYLCHLLGIRQVLLAVNKMDMVAYSQETFDQIVADYVAFAQEIGLANVTAMPVSGLKGDNITTLSPRMPWYQGPTFMQYLERVEMTQAPDELAAFCMPVQWVNRPESDFRGFAGTIVAGQVQPGDEIMVLPSKKKSTVARIVTFDGDLAEAGAGQAVTLTLADELDCSRGQVMAAVDSALAVSDQFEVTLIWMDEQPLVPGRAYYLKLGTQTVSATVAEPKYQIDVNTLAHTATKNLDLNAIGVVNITIDRPIPFAPYAQSKALGGFILIDKMSHATAAAGLIHFGLRRAQNIHWQATDITRKLRADLKHQRPVVLWMTGLSGSGKTTIANAIEVQLARMNRHTFLLDGDNLRHALNRDLGFTEADRIENIRRVGEVAKLMTDAGLIVIVALISPFSAEREMVRQMMQPGEFLEIYIDASLAEVMRRDVKGLYAKAQAGTLKNFTGIDSPYEPPKNPDIHIQTERLSSDQAAEQIVEYLSDRLG